MDERVVVGTDGVARCWWGDATPDYRQYHDTEWGRPVTDDRRLFEKLCLEGFQSGLSWLTILRKREGFRRAFAGFDPTAVAGFGPADVERLLGDAAIVRNRAKIEATITNAGRLLDLIAERGSFAAYVWSFEPPVPERGPDGGLLSETPASRAMSKDLKRRGWRFVGPTTVHAFMQAMGLVNDHLEGCEANASVAAARAALTRPR